VAQPGRRGFDISAQDRGNHWKTILSHEQEVPRKPLKARVVSPVFTVTKIFFTCAALFPSYRAAAPWDFHRKAALVSMPANVRVVEPRRLAPMRPFGPAAQSHW
jgi:hypothetical protein